MSFKIVTWNVNSIKIRIKHLLELIKKNQPDIICLQELKCLTDDFPYEAFEDLSYNLYVHGQKTYNGVAIFSKIPADNISYDFPNNPIPDQARFIEITAKLPIGYSRVISLYAPNGGTVGGDKFITKLQFYDEFTKYLSSIKSFAEHIFIGSDYNIAPFDIDVYDPLALQDSTCFTQTERNKLRTILNSGFVDNYRIKHPDKQEFSWWDYRAGAWQKNQGMRIDTIISNSSAANYISDCIIDLESRKKSKPSDHAPVICYYSKPHIQNE
ncbi:MAG: exodeoxyribonuclease III [Rickettsiaceae bacterium]|nr:exodeoxyribonuclease III [Rickettsiaceae bacterium]